jgi:hypothetical protein
MHKINVPLAVAAVLVLSCAVFAQAPAPQKTPDVSGVWLVTMQSPQGEMTQEATFTQDKEALKVSMTSPMGTDMKGEGTIKGQELQWTLTISTPNGDFALGFKAKLDGETMTGEVQMGDFGNSTFTAKKKK